MKLVISWLWQKALSHRTHLPVSALGWLSAPKLFEELLGLELADLFLQFLPYFLIRDLQLIFRLKSYLLRTCRSRIVE